LPETYKDLFDPSKPKSFPFRPGMNASADIQTKTHANVLAVPINAVTTREKNGDITKGKDKKSEEGEIGATATGDDEIEEVVFVLQKDNTVKKIKVRTDIQDINHIEILAGLKAGDEVITGPYNIVSKSLKEGDKVRIIPKEKLFTEKEK
jgi:HlyD family secretion protein